jgi:hypothetical protein
MAIVPLDEETSLALGDRRRVVERPNREPKEFL